MNIFITGVNGYLGKILSNELKTKGYNIYGCDVTGDFSSKIREIDIRNENFTDCVPEKIDIIIHLAALSSDPLCKNNEYNCFDLNVMGTLNLIEFAINKTCKQFIFASSEWVYSDSENMNEEDSLINIMKLKSEYALSKLTSEVNLLQKYKQIKMNTTILRFGIIYGGNRYKGSAVESIIKHVIENDEIEIGSKKTGRNFIHCFDVVSGIISAIGQKDCVIYNIAGDEFVDLEKIIEIASKQLKKKIKVLQNNKSNPSIRKVSNLLAKKQLNWNPSISIEDGIKSVLDFFVN
jgi:nucleoside-diphosphate-sugar epimerase